MNKLFSVLLIALMAFHLWRPLGWPGLRRRGDFWRIAIVGLVLFGLDAVLRPH